MCSNAHMGPLGSESKTISKMEIKVIIKVMHVHVSTSSSERERRQNDFKTQQLLEIQSHN